MRAFGHSIVALGRLTVVLMLAGQLAACDEGSGSDVATPESGEIAERCDLPDPGEHEIDVDGTTRAYDLYLPDELDQPAPLLVLFHGFTSTKDEIADLTGLDIAAPERGVVLAVPQALGEPSDWRVLAGFEEDAAFLDRLLATMRESPCIDDANVWLTGFSAGSAFSAVYGCAHADEIAGLGLVAALAPPLCPSSDTPIVQITHGTDDPAVSFDGGAQAVGDESIELASIPDSAATWAERAGCDLSRSERRVGGDVTVTRWSGCASGATITLQVVEGGGHTWPGSPEPLSVGHTTQTFSTSCVLLEGILGSGTDAHARCPGALAGDEGS